MQEGADGMAQGFILGCELDLTDAQLPVGTVLGFAGGGTQKVLAGELTVGSAPVACVLRIGLDLFGAGASALAFCGVRDALGQRFGADPGLQGLQPPVHPKVVAILPASPVDVAAIL